VTYTIHKIDLGDLYNLQVILVQNISPLYAGEICDVTLFAVHMCLEEQIQMQSLSPIVMDVLRS
jgi:hypothetical protein